MSELRFFKTPLAFRQWLRKNHDKVDELWVGFYKVATGKPSITWKESVDEALCFGWIDGIRKSIDQHSYKIRFTPRRRNSNWSQVNIKCVEALIEQRLMQPAGMAAFNAGATKAREYSYEQPERRVDPGIEKAVRAVKSAWTFWQTQPVGYKKVACFWVLNAKKAETRHRRLQTLIADCAAGRRIAPLSAKRTS